MHALWQDLRYSARRLGNAPWFTAAAVLTLALGIGATTTVFTFVNAVLIRALPFEEPDRLVAVWTEDERSRQSGVSHPDYLDLRERARSFESLGAFLNSTVNLSEEGRVPEQLQGTYVSGDFFRVIREQPALGRGFSDEDDREGAEPAVLLGHGVWTTRYAGDPAVIGRTVKVNSLLATIVGVMPEGMGFPENTDVWIPLANLPPETGADDRGTRSFGVLGRLAPGVTMEQARRELGTLGERLGEEHPATNRNRRPNLESYQDRVNGSEIEIVFLSLMGAVAFVLLIACANVANLLLARAAGRSREVAVRVSLGATRQRIVRQLLVESLLLAVMAGALGLAYSVYGIRWFDANTQGVGKPYWMEFTLDGTVFLFMAAVCLATVVLSGLAPALHVSNTQVTEVLKEGGRAGSGGFRVRRWAGFLVVGQIVLTLVLLSGAAFMMGSFLALYRMDPGIDTSRLLTMQLYLPLTQYPDPEPRLRIFEELEAQLAAVPGLEASALATALPLDGGVGAPLEVEGADAVPLELRPVVTTLAVSERYFEVVDLPLLQGRAFAGTDGQPGSEVAVVNQRFAELHLGGDPLGRRIRLGGAPETAATGPWYTVVGVTPDVRQRSVEDAEPDPVAYLPLRANPARGMSLLVRTPTDPARAASLVRETLRPIEPDLPLYSIRTMDAVLAEQRWHFRVFGTLFSLFAAIALVLSAVGIYSVTAYSVVQRTQEFGIRMSLGARPREISWLALRRVLVHLGIGLPAGILGAVGVGRLLGSLLVQTGSGNLPTLAIIVLLLVGVAVLASVGPARRAARLDPVAALRVE